MWEGVWVWLGSEIASFGLRWIVLGGGMLAVSRWFFGRRYQEMKREIAELKEAMRAKQGAVIIHNHVPITDGPFSHSDIDEFRTMTQSEYDALPLKREKTLYLIKESPDDGLP